MQTTSLFRCLLGSIIVILLFCPRISRADYDYIKITDPFLKKVPIAVPYFKSIGKDSAAPEKLRGSALMISDMLEFTGYFEILNRAGYLEDPQRPAITINEIKFRNWTSIGAELLVTGAYMTSGDNLIMDLRLIDTFKEKLLVGKRYQGGLDDQRRMIRRFCSDVIHYLTGNRGIFDSQIAFVSTGTGNKEIYTCDFDGHDPKQITFSKNITLSPAWSSDGKWIAYTSYAKGKPHLYIKHMKEKRGYVIDKKGTNITPGWLPGQFALGASLSFSGDPEIYLLTGTGKIIKRITNSWGIDISPSWSPDGKRVAFVSNRSGTPQIYIQGTSSGRVERLTFQGHYNTSPSWSPRGDRIAYAGIVDGQFNVFVITTDGRQLIQLTQGTGNNESPSWSPDGSLIVFSSNREGSSRIYVMTAYGTDQRRLLTMPGEQTGPAWSPRVMN